MMKKGKLILLFVLLIAAFVCAKIAYDWVTAQQTEAPISENGGQQTSQSPGTDPAPPDEDEDDIAWDYSSFPDDYVFRNQKLLNEHFEKHGAEMGFETAELYEQSANLVIHHPDVLWKKQADDGDYAFYLEETNEFVVLSSDGYIRTYFWPDSGKKYYDKQ